MGTWDVGPFGNDTAGDWCDGLDNAPADARHDTVRDTLARAAGGTGCLDAPTAEKAVAAAALVAAQCPGGDPTDAAHGPEEPLPDLTGLRTLALEALDRVLTEPSELLELWARSGGGPWQTAVNRLRVTLAPPASGEQPALS
ncbi:DUF4259 domain-containing protein [Streptomyces sp. NPDC003077]|uniref:DUF4259 domain-containing protein n=1 Tax=Streptomyces sp. NPDC003077 TaxID=3154443 RepID=UPI0033BB7252